MIRKINIEKEVRWEDAMSPIIFTATVKEISKELIQTVEPASIDNC